jgi:hypothetical protein
MTKARDLASSTPVPSTVSTTELGYVDGVTSAIQTQVDSKLATATASSTYQTKAAAGLVLLNTTSFSAVSSQSVNDVFSSTYSNYLILFTVTATNAATADIFMRLRVSGADDSTNNYNNYFTGINSGSSANNYVANSVSNWTFTSQHSSLTTGYNVARIELFGPNETNATKFTAQTLGLTSGGQYFSFSGAGLHNVATAYTGITWLKSTGTMTGNVSVYGYNK